MDSDVYAAARLLKAREAELGGTVRLLFQPAEEGGAGGKRCPWLCCRAHCI